jgi:ABC-2 type transport system permease protein
MSLLASTTPLPKPSRPSLARLAKVELRKMVDTRSGFWLLLIAVIITAVVVAVGSFVDGGAERTSELFTLSLFPMGIFLPIVGILGFTAEFSQRTALQTFTWVPQRSRIVLAKAAALLLLGIAGFAVSIVLSSLFGLIAGTDFDIGGTELGQGLLFSVLNILLGLGFGMLFGSPAVAIVVFFAAPTVIGILGELVGPIRDARDWLDNTVAWGPLSEFEASGADWGNAFLNALIWIGIPTVVGWFLLRRREVS